MKGRSAIRTDMYASDKWRTKIDPLVDPLMAIWTRIEFAELAAKVVRLYRVQ